MSAWGSEFLGRAMYKWAKAVQVEAEWKTDSVTNSFSP